MLLSNYVYILTVFLDCQEGRAETYTGTRNYTKNGDSCVRWDSIPVKFSYNNDTFPDGDLSASADYCRNPDQDPGGLWCYVDSNENWFYCKVPLCLTGKQFLVTLMHNLTWYVFVCH